MQPKKWPVVRSAYLRPEQPSYYGIENARRRMNPETLELSGVIGSIPAAGNEPGRTAQVKRLTDAHKAQQNWKALDSATKLLFSSLQLRQPADLTADKRY